MGKNIKRLRGITNDKIKKSYFKRPFRLAVTKMSIKSFVNYGEVNSSISTSGAISIYVNILQDISEMNAKVVILIESSSGNYDLELVNKTINVCEFFRNRRYEPMLQVFYKSINKGGNLPKSCPLRKVMIADNLNLNKKI